MTAVGKLRITYMKLDDIQPALRNPKEHDLSAISGSVTELGMADTPILDERTGRLVGGHGTVEALTQLRDGGGPAPAGVEVDKAGAWKIPVQRGWSSASDHQADLLLLALNRIPTRGGWNDRLTAELLDELADENPDWPALAGWTHQEVDDLLRSTDAIGTKATSFLDDLANSPTRAASQKTDDVETSETEANPAPTGGGNYVQVAWLVDVDDRPIIRTATQAAQKRWDLDTSAAALVAICRHFLEEAPTT